MGIKHTSHARFELWYHFAWATKYRKKVFRTERVKEEVENLFREIALHYDMEVGEISVLSDHVHLTLGAPPRIAPSRAAQIIKSVSTKKLFEKYRWLKQQYWGGEVWVQGYFVKSVGSGLTKEKIEEYVREQAEEI